MKANAPEKLYVDTEDRLSDSILYGFTEKRKDNDIEYVRKDAFIKKALKWYCLDCICNDTCSNTCYFKSTFKRYLEGDDNQLPPKFENAINPDGSTSENYRYRHFIKRMQDDFIEKAKKWFEQQPETYDANGVRCYSTKDFEDFRKYIGE